MPNDSVAPQIDVGLISTTGTAAVASLLQTIMRISSKDEVQGQAICVMLKLGGTLTVFNRLIQDGIVALRSTDSVKLHEAKLVIGLCSGETAQFLCQHQSAVKAFLLIAALKACPNEDKDIGNILYELQLLQSGSDEEGSHASSSQLGQIVTLLSGHALVLQPAINTTLDRITDAIIPKACAARAKGLHDRLPDRTQAELLMSVFEGIINEGIDSVTLDGQIGGIWMAAILTWLLPDQVCVLWKDEAILGPANAKISVVLHDSSEPNGEWQYREWRTTTNVRDIIFDINDFPAKPASTIPWRDTKRWLKLRMLDLSEEAINAIGSLAGSLFKCLLEFGHFHDGFQAYRVPLRELASQGTLNRLDTSMEIFGWETEDYEKFQPKLYAILCEKAAKREQNLETMLRNAYNQVYPRLALPAYYTVEDMIKYAILIGTSALGILSAVDNTICTKIYSPTMHITAIDDRIFEAQQLLSPEGTSIRKLRKLILSSMLGCTAKSLHDDDLIFVEDGIVVYPSVLFDPVVRRSSSLLFLVKRGGIRFQDQTFVTCRDVAPKILTPHMPSEDRKQLTAYESSRIGTRKYIALSEPSEWPTKYHGFQNRCTADGTIVQLRTAMQFIQPNIENTETYANPTFTRVSSEIPTKRRTTSRPKYLERSLSWIEAIEAIACAQHLSPSDNLTPTFEKTTAERLYKDGILNSTFWLAPSSLQRRLKQSPSRLVVCSRNNVMLQLFHLSISGGNQFKYVIAHGANLVKAIALAEEAQEGAKENGDMNWVIVL